MDLLQEGSALPRGLSFSERVYIAPSTSDNPDGVTVAIRNAQGAINFWDSSFASIEEWACSEKYLGADILNQLSFLRNQKSKKTCLGRPSPLIMGIVNVTPDSFSDGGKFEAAEDAYAHALRLFESGADILDIGGESTRPGAETVDLEQELARVLPVIDNCKSLGPLISIDTRKSKVMAQGLDHGATLINDVTALQYDADSLKIVADRNATICLMHSAADPKVMQDNPTYDHVLFDVIDYLRERISVCLNAGLKRDQIIIDPGVGFGKTVDHNLVLLKGLRFFHALGCPILLGVSRKSFIGKIDRPGEAEQRIGGSLSALLYGLAAGIQIFRVHDVDETRQAIAVWEAVDKMPLA
ncbi:MAG: dihydropteroate synthase [Sneathiella sp.]|nr:dihydropteroate synthase [Sneathiella sp.]